MAATPDFSRSASDYEATMHVLQRIKEREMLTAELIAEAIEDGEVKNCEVSEREGHEGDLVVTLDHTPKPGIVTYRVIINIDEREVITACERGRSKGGVA